MNKPENIPIITLSGIGCLSEISGELPLPCSALQPLQLFSSQKQANEALQHIYNGTENSLEIAQLLSSVNNAYLDFKVTSNNQPSQLKDNNVLPPVLRSVLKSHPNIFQPQFETYHGSPVKGNSVEAYSVNQRKAFILHHQQQQQHRQQQQLQDHNRVLTQFSNSGFHLNNSAMDESPLLHGYIPADSTSSPMISSPNMQQFFSAYQTSCSPQVQYSNMTSPKFVSPASASNAAINNMSFFPSNNASFFSNDLLTKQQQTLNYISNLPTNHIVSQSHRQMSTSLNHYPSSTVHQSTYRTPQLCQQISQSNQQILQLNQQISQSNQQISQMNQQTNNQMHQLSSTSSTERTQMYKQMATSNQQVPQFYQQPIQSKCNVPEHNKCNIAELDQRAPIFSPLKTRNQRLPNNIGPESSNSSSFYPLEEKSKVVPEEQYTKKKCNESSNMPIQSDQCNISTKNENYVKTDETEKRLVLKVPKLIVRKVKHFDGQKEVETLEVCKSLIKNNEEPIDCKLNNEERINYKSNVNKRKKKKNFKKNFSSDESDDNQKKDSKRYKPTIITQIDDKSTIKTETDNKPIIKMEIDCKPTSMTENNGQPTIMTKSEDKTIVKTEIDGVEIKAEVKKFAFILNKFLEMELELDADGELDINDDAEIPPESLFPRPLIKSFYTEVAKIKTCGILNKVPADQLVHIISSMDRHVRDSIQLCLNQDDDEEEGTKWFKLQVERILRSAEAACIILYLRTCPDMPKQVYLEEALEHIILFCQHHLETTLYPNFDPLYKHSNEESFSKKSRSHVVDKSILQIYNKLCEVVSLLADTLAMETLTDSSILKLSQIAISSFFVDQVSVLQLSALRVARAIFRNYVKHRDLIMDDILASLARLPSSKRNLRSYKLEENDSIQMFTALVLQLVQCTVQTSCKTDSKDNLQNIVDINILIVKSYEDSLRAAQNFLSFFLKKCSASREENDYRPLFENFLQDLFTTANLPEWPAAEVLLMQLSHLFVVTFSSSKADMNVRSSSIDYLAQIVTHLRSNILKIEHDDRKDKLRTIVEKLINPAGSTDDIPVIEDMSIYEDKLRTCLISSLSLFGKGDESYKFACEFYIGQWIRDVQIEIEQYIVSPMASIPGASSKLCFKNEDDKKIPNPNKLQELEEKKEFYHSLIKNYNKISTLQKTWNILPYDSCSIIASHLASYRTFSQNFEVYLQQICKMLSEQAIALRTKAVKALTMIVSVDSTILMRKDIQDNVHGRLLDPSTNVREAAIDLIGQFVLKSIDLVSQYYDMIIARILDTGVSVRKRVIKILKDICIEHPDFKYVPEICAKIIRRVDDEVGIKKLVTEVFRLMWFQPVSDINKSSAILFTKAVNITKVASLCKDTGFEWLEILLENLLDPKNASLRASTMTACQQLVDCLFQRLLNPEQKSDTNMIVSCLMTLNLFCKVCPLLLIPHATSLQPYLSSKVNSPSDLVVIQNVSKILELVVPLMDHPNPKFLAELEEDSMKLMLQQTQNVVQSCTSCLAAIVNKVTHNYKFVIDAFNQFLKFLTSYQKEHKKSSNNPSLKTKRSTLLRALFTTGLFCRYFDFDAQLKSESSSKPILESKEVFHICIYFTDFDDEEVMLKAILAVGFIGMRYPSYLLVDDCKRLYQDILNPSSISIKAKFTVLKNMLNHLVEEECRLHDAEKKKDKIPKVEQNAVEKLDIKEIGDAMSGSTSELIQFLLPDIMKNFLHSERVVRVSALQVVALVLGQGLVHPAQCIPYLIAISTDNEHVCHAKAEQCLNDLDSRFPGFIHMKAIPGVKMAYQLQVIIQKNNGGYLVGYREIENKISLVNHVYTLLQSNKQHRRYFLKTLLQLVEHQKTPNDFQYFLVENLAYLNYNTCEEPLFLIHNIDNAVSVTGTNLLFNFKKLLRCSRIDEEDVELHDFDIPEKDISCLLTSSFGSMLLLELKCYLKSIFGLSESKCQKYSPSEPSKLNDKSLSKKTDKDFQSEHKELIFSTNRDRESMFKYYESFKQHIMNLDAEQHSDNEQTNERSTNKYEEETIKLEFQETDVSRCLSDDTRPALVQLRRSSRSSKGSSVEL